MSKIVKANKHFRNGEYVEAFELYEQIVSQEAFWNGILEHNIKICKREILLKGGEEQRSNNTLELNVDAEIDKKNKVLISDFRYPRYDSSAGELATFGVIKMFAELGYDVTFVPKESTEFDEPYIKAVRKLGVKCKENVTYEKFKEIVVQEAKDIAIAYIFRPDVASVCVPRIRSVNLDAFIFYHAPDVYFRREFAQYKIESAEHHASTDRVSSLDQLVLDEVNSAAICDHVVCVSKTDTEALNHALANQELNKTGVAPPEISTFPLLYLNRKHEFPNYKDTDGICFIGSSEHLPNRDAIRWFLENVWQELSLLIPGLKFSIIGKTDPVEKEYYETFSNVIVVGWVDSIEDVLPKFRLSIAPLRYGAGIKGKVGISAISGVPCVISKVAAEDMDFVADEEIIVADSVNEYITNIKKLVENEKLWTKLSRNGASKAEQIYSEDSTFRRFIRILNDNGVLDSKLYSQYNTRQSKKILPISFQQPAKASKVDISIVVPGYNSVSLSKCCLTSIYYSVLPDEEFSFEVIYADDCSEDKVVPTIKSKFPNINVTQTRKNSGFVANCNNGAKVAKGRYLVLLNNDTVVLPGWLGSLLETIESVDGCDVAGSKLLYGDSRIQEAGAGLWADARTCSVGRGSDGTGLECSLPEYNYVREVDYISFASVIIRKSVWDSQKGLSNEYGFGYFDDSDFCLRARSSGGIVLYSPNSEVIHNESASFSKRKSKDVTFEKRKNGIFFRRKWSDSLILDFLPFENPSWDQNYSESICKANAERHHILGSRITEANDLAVASKRHILYFSPFPSHPASHGNQTTIQKFGEFLKSEGHAVHFVLLESHMFSQQDARDMIAAWDSFDVLKLTHFPSCNGETIRYDGWYVPGIGEQIALLCAKYSVDTVICSYVFQSRLLDFVPRYILKILDTHDKFTDRYSILDKLGKPREFFSCTKQEEGMYLSRADVVLARRDEETHYFDSISTAKVFTVPHIEDRCYLDKAKRPLQKIGLVASCNLINLDIIITFIADLIRQKPDNWGFTVAVAGEVKSLLNLNDLQQKSIVAHPSVQFLGYVDDIRDFYNDVDMVICPIMSGTGINVKTVQALAHAMPLLATQHASKGVNTAYPTHLFQDVPDLVKYLLSQSFDASLLKELSSQSRDIYEKFIDVGYENFRSALSLQQPELRKGIGLHKFSRMENLFSRKSYLVNLYKSRNQKLGRSYMIGSVVSKLNNFGPDWINISQPLPNVQSDGGVGFWFDFKEPIGISADLFLSIKGVRIKLHKSDDRKLLTTSIPPEIFNEPGDLNLDLAVLFDWEMSGNADANQQKLCAVRLVKQ